MDTGRAPTGQALVATPSNPQAVSTEGFDPSRGSLNYRISWPRWATPCDLVPLWAGEFVSFNDWVNFATTRLTGTTNSYGVEAKAICVDALGRRCIMGGDFMRARDEDAFPVRYFWECVPAIATAAGTDTTGTGVAEGKGAAPQGDRPTPTTQLDERIGE